MCVRRAIKKYGSRQADVYCDVCGVNVSESVMHAKSYIIRRGCFCVYYFIQKREKSRRCGAECFVLIPYIIVHIVIKSSPQPNQTQPTHREYKSWIYIYSKRRVIQNRYKIRISSPLVCGEPSWPFQLSGLNTWTYDCRRLCPSGAPVT